MKRAPYMSKPELMSFLKVGCCAGELVKDCPHRQAYHRLGLTPAVDEPKEGQCEFVVR